MNVAGLPVQLRKALGEVDDVLTSAAGKLQDNAGLGQPLGKHVGDDLSVAERGWRRATTSIGRRFVKAPIVGHAAGRSASRARARRPISIRVMAIKPTAKQSKASVTINVCWSNLPGAVCP